MSLPARLQPNILSIYGQRTVESGMTVSKGYQFGTVNQMYGGQVDFIGQSVLFKSDKATQIRYSNTTYYLIQEQDIILIVT